MPDDAPVAPRSRRRLFARIAARSDPSVATRAERLLLRGLERRWPAARLEALLQGLLARTQGHDNRDPAQ